MANARRVVRGMETEVVALATLRPPARNVRVHPKKQIEELARAIEKFGQIRPVIIDEDSVVLAGNGLVEAFRQLGRDAIVVSRRADLTAADKTKLMLSDNKIFALGLDDHGAILDAIRGLDDFDIPGFDSDVLRNLTLDTSAVTGMSLDHYGALPDGAVAAAKERDIPQGSIASDNGYDNEEEAELSPGEVRCPNCEHVFYPER